MPAHELNAIAFPKLNETQLAGLSRCSLTKTRDFDEGQRLYVAGESDNKFYVIRSGRVEIVDESIEGSKSIVDLGPGDFTGEVAELIGGRSPVSAIARSKCQTFEIDSSALRQLINNHPDIGDLILQAFLARRQLLSECANFTGLRVVGSRFSQDTFRVRDFLTRNRVLFTWLDVESDPEVDKLLKHFGLSAADTPVVAWANKLLLKNPSNRELAESIGLRRPLEHTVYDLIVVGAGPAGLAAAVYGASEGLRTIVLERLAPGGQAGRSMRIENYLGFPTGITGAELAERAVMQANKFGACLPVAVQVDALTFDNVYPVLHVDGGEEITAKCLLIATGAEYRLLNAEGCERFEGCGIYYAATPIEAQLCKGSDAVVVGGGNSAGQAAVFLAGQVSRVYLVIRHDSLGKDMSSYLVQRIEQSPKIEVLRDTEVGRMSGNGHLSEVELVNRKTKEVRTVKTNAVFSFIGAAPRTSWLPDEIEKDAKGFVKTGPTLAQSPLWTAGRSPYLLETSRQGVFAAGDVRSGSIKRVASAVGEGAMAVQFVHHYLSQM